MRKALFSTKMFGIVALPACRVTQPARDESKFVVKYCGSGVGDGSGVRVGSGVGEAGIGVGDEGGSIAVGGREGSGVGVAVWQEVMKMRHPMRNSFFIFCTFYRKTYRLAGSTLVEMPGIEPGSERFDPRKSTSVVGRG